MSEDPDQFVDVDFDQQPEFVFGDKGAKLFSACAAYEDVEEVWTDKQCREAVEWMDAYDTGLEWLVSRIYDQGREGACFPPGTRIRMADGSNKPIEQVRLLDEVLTAEGNTGPVTHLFVREERESLIKLDLFGHRHLRMTKEHPVLTKNGYVEASQIKVGDWVCLPRYAPERTKVLQTADHLPARKLASRERRVGTLKKQGSIGGKEQITITKSEVPDLIELSEDFGRIVGLFLAEGSTSKQKVCWTFSLKEKDTLAAELIELLQRCLGIVARIQIRHSACNVVVYGTTWARLFESICSTGSAFKNPHQELLSGPRAFLKAMLFGWLSGDGHRKNYDCNAVKIQGVTVSRDMALAMFDIANFLGYRPTIAKSIPKISHNVKKRLPRWDVCFHENSSENDKRFSDIEDARVWRRVRGICEEEYHGPVFNFEVTGDNSYVAEGIGVHNCVANACGQANEVKQAEQFGVESVVPLSAISLYKQIGRSASSGAFVDDGVETMASLGILPLDTPANRERFEHVMPNTGFSQRYPDGWKETSKLFTGVEFHPIRSLQGIVTAGAKRHPVIVGRDGHSICYVRLRVEGNSWAFDYANSWNERWGFALGNMKGGFGRDTIGRVKKSARYAFALRSVNHPLLGAA